MNESWGARLVVLMLVLVSLHRYYFVGYRANLHQVSGMVSRSFLIGFNEQIIELPFGQVRVERLGELKVGDVVRFEGNWICETQVFYYCSYIFESSSYEKIQDLNWSQQAWLWFSGKLEKLRGFFLSVIHKMYRREPGAMVAGMVFGLNTDIDKNLYESLKVSGLVHIVVASGGNIALVAAIFKSLLPVSISRKLRYLAIYIVILVYALITGFEPPIVRASVMLGLVWSTKLTGKQTSTLWVLFVAALGLIFVNPKLLLSISFHLSLLSTFGLVSMESYVRRALKLLFGSLPQKIPLLNLEEVLSQTLAAQILVVPYIMWVFGEFSPYGVLTNVLVSGVVFPLTVGGGISVALYLLFPELGMMVAYFVELLAEYLILVAKFFS